MRRAAKVDDNHGEIRDIARKFGAYWHDTHQLKGFCDAMVVHKGKTMAIEVKDGSKVPSKRKLTPMEQAFSDNWQRHGGLYHIVETDQDMIDLLL